MSANWPTGYVAGWSWQRESRSRPRTSAWNARAATARRCPAWRSTSSAPSANLALGNLPALARHGVIDRRREEALARRQVEALRVRCADTAQAVGELSGGNQQKVVIGRWLERDCQVLLFDEPTRGIDVGAKFDIYALLAELTRRGKALVVVSSDLRELMLICDRIGVLSAGRMVDTFERDAWTQDALLAAAFAGYKKRDALLATS